MYSMGVPIGMFVDTRGPRPAVIGGSILLALGYFPLRQAFEAGRGSVAFLCLVSYLTGLGGCMAFAAAVKTSALNWPHHRGTATAFPLAAFGLSAFFFSVFGSLIVPGDTSAFLLLLAIGTFVLTFVSFFFLHVLPPTAHYHALAPGDDDGSSSSQQLRRTVSEEDRITKATATKAAQQNRSGGGRGRYYQPTEEPGRFPDHHLDTDGGAYEGGVGEGAAYAADAEGAGSSRSANARASSSTSTAGRKVEDDGGDLSTSLPPQPPLPAASTAFASHYASIGSNGANGAGGSSSASASVPRTAGSPSAVPSDSEDADQDLMDETSSLMSKGSSLPGEVLVQNSVDMDQSHRVDIRGWKLLRDIEFWQFFAIMGILAGIGLMTIKYVVHCFVFLVMSYGLSANLPSSNIGHDANALWKHYDESVDDNFLIAHQQMHVSILSVGSFSGRLLSGEYLPLHRL